MQRPGCRRFTFERRMVPPPSASEDGIACTLSADGKLVLALRSEGGGSLTLIPTGTGTPVSIDRAGFQQIVNAELFPNGRPLLVDALLSGHGRRVYVQDLAGGKPRPISPEGFGWSGHPVSPDGKFVVAYRDWSEDLFLFSTDGDASRAIPNTKKLDPVRWAPGGGSLGSPLGGECPPAPSASTRWEGGRRRPPGRGAAQSVERDRDRNPSSPSRRRRVPVPPLRVPPLRTSSWSRGCVERPDAALELVGDRDRVI